MTGKTQEKPKVVKRYVAGRCRMRECGAMRRFYLPKELQAENLVAYLSALKGQCSGNGRPHHIRSTAISEFQFDQCPAGEIKIYEEEVEE